VVALENFHDNLQVLVAASQQIERGGLGFVLDLLERSCFPYLSKAALDLAGVRLYSSLDRSLC
jgi:hypothetical protein